MRDLYATQGYLGSLDRGRALVSLVSNALGVLFVFVSASLRVRVSRVRLLLGLV